MNDRIVRANVLTPVDMTADVKREDSIVDTAARIRSLAESTRDILYEATAYMYGYGTQKEPVNPDVPSNLLEDLQGTVAILQNANEAALGLLRQVHR